MIRFMAALLIVGACSGLGFGMAERVRQRPRQLRQLQFALSLLQGEIRYRHTPLPSALSTAAARISGPVAEMFTALARGLEAADGQSIALIWEQVRQPPGLGLNLDDRAVLDSLVPVLGCGGVEEQVRQLDLHLEQLRQAEQAAELWRQRNEKMWCYLGVFAGIAIVLILL